MSELSEGYRAVKFLSPETACNVLEGLGVHVTTHDGVEATGVLEHYIPRDGHATMIRIYAVTDPEHLILGTDIRNLAKIVVP